MNHDFLLNEDASTSLQYRGVVSFYQQSNRYGFISYNDEENIRQSIFFKSDVNSFTATKQRWAIGDVVSFNIIHVNREDETNSTIAEIVGYDGNPRLESVFENAKNNNWIIEGYVKVFKDVYFFQEKESKILFFLSDKNITNIGFVPPDAHTLVKGKLVKTDNNHKAKVLLTDVQYDESSPLFMQNPKQDCRAIVEEVNEHSLKIKLLDYPYRGVIRFGKKENIYKEGDFLWAWLLRVGFINRFYTFFFKDEVISDEAK